MSAEANRRLATVNVKAPAGARPVWVEVQRRFVPGMVLVVSLAAVLLGLLSLPSLAWEAYPVPTLGALCFMLQLLVVHAYAAHKLLDWKVLIGSLLAFASLLLLRELPVLVTVGEVSAFFDHSLFSAGLLILVGIPAMMSALYYLLGATPQAEDASRYPLILFPVLVAVCLYGFIIYQLLLRGVQAFSPQALLQPYLNYSLAVKTFIAGDWPKWTVETYRQAGMLNHLSGTLLLMLLTSLISIPFGVAAGIYLYGYGNHWWGRLTRFAITSLRAISTLILGLTAFNLVYGSRNTVFGRFVNGTHFDGISEVVNDGGSFLTASLILALLVIPIITRATEEGCRSLPRELMEGSIALGASEGTTLSRITLRWAMPNIVTAVLLGCAEAAGSVTILLFIAGRGDAGIGVFRQVTSLAFLIFDIYYGGKDFQGMMGPYQYTAGVMLLLITLCLGALAIVSKRWLVKRYRGG